MLYRGSQTAFGQMAFDSETMQQGRAEHFRRLILDALAERDLTRDQLKALCSAEGLTAAEEQILFHPWGGVFRALAENGEIAYTSDGNRVFTRLKPLTPMEKDEALRELMRRYVRHYGPVTLRTHRRFSACRSGSSKRFWSKRRRRGSPSAKTLIFYIPDELPEGADIPPALFLAGFDQLLLGYRKTDNPFLPTEHINASITTPASCFRRCCCTGAFRRSGSGRVKRWRSGRLAKSPQRIKS